MDTGTLLNDRYRISDALGKSRLADTFLAVDERTNALCVVKQLSVSSAYSDSPKEIASLSGSDEAKIVELFKREGNILAHLDHPRVPELVDFFAVETEYDTLLYIVQEYINATSLAKLVDAGRHFSESEALHIALEVTDILEYLHDRSPPLVHRDIKPSNVLYADDGEVSLIDFGAVKNRLVLHDADTSTVVGTYGYMPLEQFQGNAVPASDIYSLGMTLIAILSHREPSEFAVSGTRLDFRRHVHVSRGFSRILAKMVEPDLKRRYRSASELRQDLAALLAGRRSPSFRRLIAAGAAALVVLAGYFVLKAPMAQRNESAPAPAVEPIEPLVPVEARGGVLTLDIFKSFKYVDTGWPMGLSVGQTNARGLDTRPYEELRAEPDYTSPQVLYGYLPLGNSSDSRITFVVDELERPAWVLYVDRNNNEDLADDGPAYVNAGTGKLAASISLPVEIVTASGQTITRPYNIWFWVNEREEESFPRSLRPRFYARCHYLGEVDLGGRIFTAVAFEHRQHNGLFAENGIYIDLNEDGKLDASEHFMDGEPVRVGDDVYRIELAYP